MKKGGGKGAAAAAAQAGAPPPPPPPLQTAAAAPPQLSATSTGGGAGQAPAKKGKRANPSSSSSTAAAASAAPIAPTGVIPPQAIQAATKDLGMTEIGVDVASFIATTVEYQLREIIEDATKVRTQSRRQVLTTDDVNYVMRLRGQQPLYGYGAGADAMMEVTTADGKQSMVVLSDLGERKEDLAQAMQTELPKVPREAGLVLHWLAIDGVQPLVPQNPTPTTRPETPVPITTEGGALVIPEKTHPLSEELWMYYKRVVKAIMTPTTPEAERRLVFTSLGSDPGLHELVPYLSLHVHNTVTAVVGAGGRGALDPLWAAMRIFRCMVVNPHMHLELYLHQMLPSVMTVIANNRLASTSTSSSSSSSSSTNGGGEGSGNGDHFALRTFAAQTLAMLVRKYANVYRPLASVICKTFAERTEEFLQTTPAHKGAIATLYGTIIGITHLGPRPVEVVLLPVAGQLLSRLQGIMEDRSLKLRKRVEAQHCYAALVAAVGEAMERMHRQPFSARIELLAAGETHEKGSGNSSNGSSKSNKAGKEGGGAGMNVGAEALVAYAAQSHMYAEHLLFL